VSIQYRVAFGKNDEAVDGPDDAEVVVTVAVADAAVAGTKPEVAFMTGKLKNTGPTGPLFVAFRDGSAAATISRLASRP
jgi:hypothetical protein